MHRLLYWMQGPGWGHHTKQEAMARTVKRTLTTELPNSAVNAKNVHGFKDTKWSPWKCSPLRITNYKEIAVLVLLELFINSWRMEEHSRIWFSLFVSLLYVKFWNLNTRLGAALVRAITGMLLFISEPWTLKDLVSSSYISVCVWAHAVKKGTVEKSGPD